MLLLALGDRHDDERGTIQDLLTEHLDSATLILSRAGAVRGNHYHLATHQWTYVLSGELEVRYQTEEGDNQHVRVWEGDMMMSPPGEAHAWRAIEDTTVLVLTRGPRSGVGYESDTYRLEKPLIR